ncbi:hypothetical protein [Croceicoccus mobilis]|uniref:hypothetical protein n=1 Tax=Croceicoccus mobilis TaxID=1703339 RepID=UPI000A886AB7|nr:hypothetical protein [Croceicoccus mobilis]
MRFPVLLIAAFSCLAAPAPIHAAESCSVDGAWAHADLAATTISGGVELDWRGGDDQPMRLRMAVKDGQPVIERLDIAGTAVLRDAAIDYTITSGMRRITGQQLAPLRKLGVEITAEEVDRHKWDAFWDAPLDLREPDPSARLASSNQPPIDGIANQPGLPRSPGEIERSQLTYAIDSCTVTGKGSRATIRFGGVSAGPFAGDLVITAFRGTNLIKVEYVASTDRPSVAYKYDVGITGIPIGPETRVGWRDLAGGAQHTTLTGRANDAPAVIKAANRLIVASTGNGASLAAFPPPHDFFWARELEEVVGYNWYEKSSDGTFGFGIRQGEQEVREKFRANWTLYGAPPGSEQRMALFLYPTADGAEAARDEALAFTRGDRYAQLPGYKVMAHHYHLGMGERLLASGDPDMRLPDFDALRASGIDIASVTDIFPDQRNPGGPMRLEVLKAYYDGAARLSDSDFLVIPNVEAINILGGHWDVLQSRPVLWLEHRADDEPFRSVDADGDTVYRLGNAEEAARMIEETGMLVYMPHPRTKGSTHYPDAIKDGPAFNSDWYRGAGWRWGMGSDLSERRLSGKRVLPLFDDMNNWAAVRGTRPKYLLAITETFDKKPGDDIYANNPVNYLRLDALPAGQDYGAVNEVLNRGDYFVTSGEVLIPDAGITGRGRTARLEADVQWTFPLDIVEVIWGDGRQTHREAVDTSDLPAMGSRHFSIPFDGSGAKWVRFAAWDTAGNGAMTQPVVPGRD